MAKKYNPICNDCEFWKSFYIPDVWLKRCEKPGNSIFGGNGCPIKDDKCEFKVKRLNVLKRWWMKKRGKYSDYCRKIDMKEKIKEYNKEEM